MGQKKILVADDEMMVVKLVKFKLEKEGYEVVTATDGEQALNILLGGGIDLVVTDLLMPVHSGLEITQQAKSLPSGKIPVIILSGAGMEKNVLEAFKIGVDDFVNKPFSPEELTIRIKKLL